MKFSICIHCQNLPYMNGAGGPCAGCVADDSEALDYPTAFRRKPEPAPIESALAAAGLNDTHEMLTFGPLPTSAAERKDVPVYSGVLRYFPDALVELARVSKKGNDQHNPGKPLHWDRSKSGDELDALTRHLIEAGTMDSDGMRHSAKLAWRALANLQKELEKERSHG